LKVGLTEECGDCIYQQGEQCQLNSRERFCWARYSLLLQFLYH